MHYKINLNPVPDTNSNPHASYLYNEIHSLRTYAIVYVGNFNLCQYQAIALPSFFQQAPIILLKEGTDTSQGKPQILSNITACLGVVDAVRTTLGPRGLDKLVVDGHGKFITFCHVVWAFSNSGHSLTQLVSRHFITHHHAHLAYIVSYFVFSLHHTLQKVTHLCRTMQEN